MAKETVTCPDCSALISIVALQMPSGDGRTRLISGTVFKRCPRCEKWSWMKLQPAGTT